MDLFEKIITDRITSPLQLGEAERIELAKDPSLQALIEQNAELRQAGIAPPAPDMQRMLAQVSLRESMLREPGPLAWLEQFFGQGWQAKSLATISALAVVAAALVAVPRLMDSGARNIAQTPAEGRHEPDDARTQELLAASRGGAWLEYSIKGESSPSELKVLGEMLSLAVSDNSAGLEQAPSVTPLRADGSFAVFVPELGSSDPRVARIDGSIRRVERFQLERQSNRLYVGNAWNAADMRVIHVNDTDIAFPAALGEQELLSMVEQVAPAFPLSALPKDPPALRELLSSAYAGSGSEVLADGQAVDQPDAVDNPGMSADTAEKIRRFEDFELRLGQRFANSLENYHLSEEQIEVYRRDMEQEMTMYLLLPSNWDQLERKDLDDYVYSEMLRQFHALGIETAEINREQIAVYVNDEDPDSQQLPEKPQRLTVEIR